MVELVSNENTINTVNSQDDMAYIHILASDALKYINQKADNIISENALEHYLRMERLEWELEQRMNALSLLDSIHPYTSIEDWYESLTDEDQSGWIDLYQRYQYGPEGDSAIGDEYDFAWNVMDFLRNKDPYLQQPFCAYCDSRGHKEGECMKMSKSLTATKYSHQEA